MTRTREEELLLDAEANRIIADKDLIDITTRELNKILREGVVAREVAKRIKQRRRTMKMRSYEAMVRGEEPLRDAPRAWHLGGGLSEYQIALAELQSWSDAAQALP